MKQKFSSGIIQKYLEGKCSPEEEKLVHEWYSSFEDDSHPLELVSPKERSRLKSRMMREIRGRIGLRDSSKGKVIRMLLYSVSTIAAVLFIAVSIFKYLPAGSVKQDLDKITYITRVTNSTSLIKRHTFPDGSEAWMQPATSISYKKSFDSNLREVSIQGEAFFDVARDPKKPFIIHANGVDVKVLGTSFNVNARSRIEKVEVSVLTGKVFVAKNAPETEEEAGLILLPTEKAIYRNSDEALSKDKVSEDALAMWNKNSLSFDNIPVTNVVNTLNKVFRTNIRVADAEVTSLTLKADFSGLNLPAVLELMGKSLDLTYSLDDGVIILKKI